MRSTGRALRRSSQAENGSSSFSDAEPNGVDPRPDTIEPPLGKQGVLLEDLLRAEAPAQDGVNLIDNTTELEVGQWPAAKPAPTAQESSDESGPAAEETVSPPERADAHAETITPNRLPAWVWERRRPLVIAGVAAIGLLVTGGIIAFSGPGGAGPSPDLGTPPTVVRASPVRVAPPRPEPSPHGADTKPSVEPPPGLVAGAGQSKRRVRTIRLARGGAVATTGATPVPASQRADGSVTRPAGRVARQVRSRDGAPVTRLRPATGALALYNEGARLQKQGASDAAIVAYVRALAEDPSLIEAHNNLAVLRMHGGDQGGAEQSLQSAIGLNSRYGPAYANLGRLYIQQRRTDQAEVMLLRAATLMPSNASVRNNLALLYQMLGRDEDEANAWRSALALGSEDPTVHYNLAVSYQGIGEPALARTHYEKALAAEHRLPSAYRASARRALDSLKAR